MHVILEFVCNFPPARAQYKYRRWQLLPMVKAKARRGYAHLIVAAIIVLIIVIILLFIL